MRRHVLSLAALALPALLAAQGHDHGAMPPRATAPGAMPALAGQAAFATIAEVVRQLDLDLSTDWSRVNLDALREHLRDMHDVTLQATVRTVDVPGGFEARVTGTGRVTEAIRRMTTAHAAMVSAEPGIRMTVSTIPGGVRVRVVATEDETAREALRLRGLGFFGVMAMGDHHEAHHLMLARGTPHAGHGGHRH